VIAPLVVQHELLGFLYADIEGLYGRFEAADRDLLAMLASQAAVALANLRTNAGLERTVVERTADARSAQAEAEQRAGELAIINGIQQGIAGSLDLRSIIQLAGSKLADLFATDTLVISWLDEPAGLLHLPFVVERGRPVQAAPVRIPPQGPGRRWIDTLMAGQPVRWNDQDEYRALGIPVIDDTGMSRSGLAVPIRAGDRSLGFISVENMDREAAFGDAELRLLSTVASSVGTALENARLFDETQRLLTETERRSAELALINGIQEGMARELNFQAIVDLVGDKLRELFKTEDLSIRWWDEPSDTWWPVYAVEHGVHLPKRAPRPVPRDEPAWGLLHEGIGTRLGTRAEQLAAGMKGAVPGTDWCLSIMGAPIRGTQRILGAIVIEHHEREHAFSEADLRVLTTVGATMGGALENARLFDETQRLLKETEARNAELAVINSIQQAVGAALDFQAIVDAVGDKLREVFASGDLGIVWWDEASGTLRHLYIFEHGQRLDLPPLQPPPGSAPDRFIRERRSWVVNSRAEQAALGMATAPGTDAELSVMWVPMLSGGRLLGAISLSNHERENAFGADDERLVSTVASSMAVALLNAKSYEAERQRVAELAVINSVQHGISGSLDFQGIVDLVGEKLREVFA
ncbi:MAG TPA: GAF domain-containing protein, partial [Burkholderiaceae bacterium]|nr:GAF domain-containing protein [Burkholderiaceae bacterium]